MKAKSGADREELRRSPIEMTGECGRVRRGQMKGGREEVRGEGGKVRESRLYCTVHI